MKVSTGKIFGQFYAIVGNSKGYGFALGSEEHALYTIIKAWFRCITNKFILK